MIRHHTKLITPKMAQQFLAKTVDAGVVNRNLSQKTVQQYAEIMKNGGWKLNGESISFDEDGFLLNGQHRLHACILANTPFITDIATGVERAAFDTIDTGRGRSAGQVLQIDKVKYYNSIASIIRGAEQIRAIGHTGSSDLKLTNTEVRAEYYRHRELYDNIAAMVAVNQARTIPAKTLGAVFFYLVNDLKQDIETVENFINGITSLDTQPNAAIDKFRKWLTVNKNHNIAKSSRTIMGFLILTWNAMVDGAEKLPTYSEKCEASFADSLPEFHVMR